MDWLASSNKISSRDEGVEIGQQLLDRNFIRAHAQNEFRDETDSLYLVISFESSEALNTDSMSECEQVRIVQQTLKTLVERCAIFYKKSWESVRF